MLAPEAPLDAYRSDLARDKTREDFGGADTIWLLTAHCLARISRASDQDLQLLGSQCASALGDFTRPTDSGPETPPAEIADLLLVVEGLSGLRSVPGADALIRGIRGMVTRMADAGALSMAYTTAGFTRRVAGHGSDRERGLLAADHAMVARLLGDLETADQLYRAAETIGEKARDLMVLSRSYIGRGVVDRVRGNYPRSRIFFERGLELAETIAARDLMRLAHQGLTICHAIGRNFDRGLQHAWATFRLADGDGGREVEALANLAQLCLDAGFPAAALRGYAAVLGRTQSPRVSIGALGGAAIAAAQAGELGVLERAATEIDDRIESSGLPYESAQALYQLAMAFAAAGDPIRRDACLTRARRIAKARGFFELLHKTDTDQVLGPASTTLVPLSALTPSSQDVVAALADIDVGEAASVLALTRQA